MAEKSIIYKKRILKQLYFNDSLSSADLSAQINLSLPITTKMVNELIQESLVLEMGYAPSTGGRKPLMYSIRPDSMYIVAIAMDQFITRIAIFDMKNTAVTEVEKFELPLTKNGEALSILIKRANKHINKSGIKKDIIIGIGIGMPGFIDAGKGLNYSFLETGGKSIIQLISESTGLPVLIDNDSSLIALAELKFGAAHNKKSAMIVNLGWGVGLGMILNGALFKGYNGFAGEFSHIPLFLNNKLCSCGKSGCLETEASLLVVVEKAEKGLKEGQVSMLQQLPKENFEQAAQAILSAAAKGDKFAVELLSEAGYNIGRGVAILIHLLNPEAVILSGMGSSAGKVWQAPVQQALNEHCIPRLAINTQIEISALGYDAELIGAAALVMENFERAVIKKTHKLESGLLQNN
ncbi:MAG: ROK family protein [Bacteroidota bacterium]|nr:ROK family protein [Bacteroidota bacterium]MDP4212434.1 ROK family protein [Bacteroidota bacterium]